MARILIVDDDPVFGELTARRLRSGGHEVQVMGGPVGVLTEVRRVEYDVLLLDVVMPGISGPLLAEALSARRSGSMKLVFLSSVDPTELASLATRHKADGWISKSASKGELLSRLGALGVL